MHQRGIKEYLESMRFDQQLIPATQQEQICDSKFLLYF